MGHLLHKIGEVVLSALPARLRTDDTRAYIHMDCKGGIPVSAPGVGGNDLWNKIIVAHTLKWPSGFVCLAIFFIKKQNYHHSCQSTTAIMYWVHAGIYRYTNGPQAFQLLSDNSHNSLIKACITVLNTQTAPKLYRL